MKAIFLIAVFIISAFGLEPNQIIGVWKTNEEMTSENVKQHLYNSLVMKAREANKSLDEKNIKLIKESVKDVKTPDVLLNIKITFEINGSGVSEYTDGTQRDVGKWLIENETLFLKQMKSTWEFKLVNGHLIVQTSGLTELVLSREK